MRLGQGRKSRFTDCVPSRSPHFSYINTATCLDRARLPDPPSLPLDLSLLFFYQSNATTILHNCPYDLSTTSLHQTQLIVNPISQSSKQITNPPKLNMPPKKTETTSKPKAAPSHPSYQVCRVYSGSFAIASGTNRLQDMISDAIVHVCSHSPCLPAHRMARMQV